MNTEAVHFLVENPKPYVPAGRDERPEQPEEALSREPKLHPLARFLDLTEQIRPPRWVVQGLIAEGVLVIAGPHGVGKTTAMLPTAMVSAQLCAAGNPLALKAGRWRHVIWITEDPGQAHSIVMGLVHFAGLGIRMEDVKERLHLVPAVRMEVSRVVEVADEYRVKCTRIVDGVEMLPLVVFDTKSSVFHVDDENDNAAASAIVAALKQQFHGCPVWLITHVSKTDIGRSNVEGLTSRGAGALDADANATAFLVREGDERYLVLGKVRYEPHWRELRIRTDCKLTHAPNAWGESEPTPVRWGIPEPAEEGRAKARERTQEAARRQADTALRTEILNEVDTAWKAGNPLNRTGVKGKVERKSAEVVRAMDALLDGGWLYDVPIPSALRVNSAKSSFLIRLSDVERQDRLQGRALPAERLAIPPSCRRAEADTPPVPNGNERRP